MMHEAVFAGYGGQGVLLIGRILTYMLSGKEISFMPAYGPEMRGGTASCAVIVSDEPIGSPMVTNPSILIAMNKLSLNKFEECVQPNGIIIVNSSIIEGAVKRNDLKVYYVPMNELAVKLGNARYANMLLWER